MGKLVPVNREKDVPSPLEKSKGFSPARAVRYQCLRLRRLRGSPFFLARGVAIGVFVGLTPTIPFHTALILIFCAFLRGHPVAGVVVSLLVSNPLTIPAEYYISWKVGTVLTGSSFSWEKVEDLMALARESSMFEAIELVYVDSFSSMLSVLLGGVLFSLPFAVATYFLALHLYFQREKRRMSRLLKTNSYDSKSGEKLPRN